MMNETVIRSDSDMLLELERDKKTTSFEMV